MKLQSIKKCHSAEDHVTTARLIRENQNCLVSSPTRWGVKSSPIHCGVKLMKDVGQTAGPNISGDAEEFCFISEAPTWTPIC